MSLLVYLFASSSHTAGLSCSALKHAVVWDAYYKSKRTCPQVSSSQMFIVKSRPCSARPASLPTSSRFAS